MADDINKANDPAAQDLERAIAAARGVLAPGIEGDCDLCGEWSGSLISGVCAPCHKKHGLA